MAFNPDFQSIGEAFTQHYYTAFDVADPNLRAQTLASLYDAENSYMTFEGAQMKGRDTILAKFQTLSFQKIQHAVTCVDCQPLHDGSIMVMVLGQLKTDDDPPQTFSHSFQLRPSPSGSFYIGNEIFRLAIHNR